MKILGRIQLAFGAILFVIATALLLDGAATAGVFASIWSCFAFFTGIAILEKHA